MQFVAQIKIKSVWMEPCNIKSPERKKRCCYGNIASDTGTALAEYSHGSHHHQHINETLKLWASLALSS